jgi:Esterase PHB depolymerase
VESSPRLEPAISFTPARFGFAAALVAVSRPVRSWSRKRAAIGSLPSAKRPLRGLQLRNSESAYLVTNIIRRGEWIMIGRERTRGCKDGFATIITRIVFLCAIVFLNAKPGVSASLQSIDDFGPNPGNLNMYVYVPDGHEPKPAMVIALHGCVQQASTFDDETGLTKFADKLKFLLLLPEQPKANNEYQCFNWFQTEDNQKNQGESGSIRNMIQYMIDTYDVTTFCSWVVRRWINDIGTDGELSRTVSWRSHHCRNTVWVQQSNFINQPHVLLAEYGLRRCRCG